MKKNIILYGQLLLILLLLVLLSRWAYNRFSESKKEAEMSLQLNQLRSVAKLVLWEQDFTLNNTESISRKYFGVIETKESVHSKINGRMGFHIDLADSIHTQFIRSEDTIIIKAPLRNTYISLDLASLEQIKESSLDPTLELKKEEVVKDLQQKALEEFVPNIEKNISHKDIRYQEEKLMLLTGNPVKIILTEMPKATDFIWKKD